MILYRYFGSHALETLKDNLLKTATVSSLNDPFEVLYRLSGEMTLAKAKRYLKRRRKADAFFEVYRARFPQIRTKKDLKIFVATKLDELAKVYVEHYHLLNAQRLVDRELIADRILRVVCFSETNVDRLDELLMWSHYGNKHKGVRIGFEFPAGITCPFKIVPMQYRQERVALDLTGGTDTYDVKNAIEASVKVKSLAWKYEREHRMITLKDFCIPKQLPNGQRADFISFKRDWVKCVDLGVRSSTIDLQAMKELIMNEYPKAQLRKAAYHTSDYALEYCDA